MDGDAFTILREPAATCFAEYCDIVPALHCDAQFRIRAGQQDTLNGEACGKPDGQVHNAVK